MTGTRKTKQVAKENSSVKRRGGRTMTSRAAVVQATRALSARNGIRSKLNGPIESADTSRCKESGSAVCSYTVATPVGDYELQACGRGVHRLDHVAQHVTALDLNPDLSVQVKLMSGDGGNRVVREAVAWLQKYFHGDVTTCKLPAICHLTDVDQSAVFMPRVWHTLATRVEFGSRVSYAQLASLCGHDARCARAVGTAMRRNPVSILVPCHRVVKADGSLGNYSGGHQNSLKQWLLEHESAQ